jgi:diguanylate cyclase (GGDEF)-like protein
MLAGLVQRHLARRRIASLEIVNPATGFATAGYLERRLEEEVVRCRELGHAMTLARIQLNELEGLAEQFGPDFRARVQAEMAGLIQAWRRPTDLVGHGIRDSLVVLMPSSRKETADRRLEDLRRAVEAHNFPRRKRMSLGVGLGTYPADAEDPQELLNCVDKALQESSRAGSGVGAAYPSLAA